MSRRWWDPFKPRVTLTLNASSGNEVETKEPMPWQDAAKVALIITLTQSFIGFFTFYTYDQICENPYAFLYKLFVFMGGTFFVTFCTFAGISYVAASRK